MSARRSLVAWLGLTAVLAACAAASADWTPLPSGADPPAACARPGESAVIEISADNLRFSAPCIAAPVDTTFIVRFTNNERESHNVAIYADRSLAVSYVVGDTIVGPNRTVDYPGAELPAGDFYFLCNVHPAMNGALYVR